MGAAQNWSGGVILKATERCSSDSFPWLPIDGGFIKPQHYSLATADWLTLSRDVKPWDLDRLGCNWQLSSGAAFAADLAESFAT